MIGLIQVDGKLPNYVLMKVSTYYKELGEPVEFVRPKGNYKRIYASAILQKSYEKCLRLQERYGEKIEIGGTGWNLTKTLPPEIEACDPDYSLYTVERIAPHIRGRFTKKGRHQKAVTIINSGLGFTSRGCARACPFCVVPIKEGRLRQDKEIRDILNPRSNRVILMDNNLTCDPYALEKLQELRDRKLEVNISQGVDIRVMTDELAFALSQVKHDGALHFAWDMMEHEDQVQRGVEVLSRYVKPRDQACYMLVGFNTSFEEDQYRYYKLCEWGVRPYVMVYNDIPDKRLHHFERWVNGFYHKVTPFSTYEPWVKEQKAA